LHDFRPAENPRAFPTPRTWVYADQIRGANLPADITFELLKGTVGEGAASEYLAFLKIARDLPNVDKILLNPDKAPIPESPAARYAITTALAMKATTNNMDRMMQYTERLPIEFQVVFVRTAVRRDDSVSE